LREALRQIILKLYQIATRFCGFIVNQLQSVVNHKQIVAICDKTGLIDLGIAAGWICGSKIGRFAMHTWVRSSVISRFAGVMMTAWLCGAGPAWAGGGGSDGGVSQPFLQQVCTLVGAQSCLQPPTLAQIILGITDYQNTTPDFVRGPLGNIGSVSGGCSVSGSPFPLCSTNNAVGTANPLAPSSITLSDLSNLTPIAFQAVSPVALGSPLANSFLYPVLTGPDGQHMLDVVIDYLPWTSKSFVKGQAVGSFTFPMVILNADNSETPVVATLNLTATCSGAVAAAPGCLAGTVTGIPGTSTTPPPTAAQLGIQFSFQLAASPNLSTPHAIITFNFPVIVALKSDPVYFGVDSTGTPTFINQFSGQATAFSRDDRGFTPASVGRPVGVSPYPAPLCPAAGCPSTPPLPPILWGFCATIAGTPAAATFASVGTEGTTYATSPVTAPLPQCPSK
jgi:hypothetical protein